MSSANRTALRFLEIISYVNTLMLSFSGVSVFKIEKGVPVPYRGASVPAGIHRETLAGMEPGDSFFVPEIEVRRVRNAISNNSLTLRKRYSVRKVEGGYRCWCTGLGYGP